MTKGERADNGGRRTEGDRDWDPSLSTFSKHQMDDICSSFEESFTLQLVLARLAR